MTQTEALKLALEAFEYIEHNYMSLPAPATKAITAIKAALEAKDEPYAFEALMYPRVIIDPVTGNVSIGTVTKACGLECDCTDVCKLEANDEPVKLRRGDILRCNESDELCTVWATSTSGKTLVKWKDNDFGNYTAEQIGELFWIEPKEEDEPDYKALWQQMCERCDELDKKLAQPKHGWTPERIAGVARLKAQQDSRFEPQRTWVGLTDEEISELIRATHNTGSFVRAIEAKLKQKNFKE